jgi:hypothetical protein
MIQEDPDDLGYWIEDTFGDWNPRVPEFIPPGYALNVCNRLIPEREQRAIVHASEMAFMGRDLDAERSRAEACYDFAWRHADRQYRGLPTGRIT